jgi:glutathione S-transferase
MKIYDFKMAPNPRRVRIFLAEKGIDIYYEQVDLTSGKNREAWFIEKNPVGGLPVLEFDDGTYLAESVAICRYFEMTYPAPPLMGVDARDCAFVEMWNRRMELEVFHPIARSMQHTHPFFKDRIQQFPEYGGTQRAHAIKRLEWLDSILAQRPFIAGERYTIADITAQCGIDIGAAMGAFQIPDNIKHVKRWHESVSSRPSAKA